MQGGPYHLKSPPASETPHELHDFWESAVEGNGMNSVLRMVV
jgi:hypothetical protein